MKLADFKNEINQFLYAHSLITRYESEKQEKEISKQNKQYDETLLSNSLEIYNFFDNSMNLLREKILNYQKSNNCENFPNNNIYLPKSEDQSQVFLADDEFNLSAMSEDCLFEYDNLKKNTKNITICFDLPMKRDRAMSENDEESFNLFNSIKGKEKELTGRDNTRHTYSMNNNSINQINELHNKIYTMSNCDKNQSLNNFQKFEKLNEKNLISKEKNEETETDNITNNNLSNLIYSTNEVNNSSRGKLLEKKLIKFSKKPRLSSEEMEKRIKKKLEQAEKNKNNLKQIHTNNYNRIMNKIKDIKTKKKLEKMEKIQKLYKKIENFNKRHQDYLHEKISKVKSENEKIAEIKFLIKIDKENRNSNILKKLDLSIDRRKKYIEQRLRKTKLRNKKDEELNQKSINYTIKDSYHNIGIKDIKDEIKVKFLNKIAKDLKNELNKNQIENQLTYNSEKFSKSEKSSINNSTYPLEGYEALNAMHNQDCLYYNRQKSCLANNNLINPNGAKSKNKSADKKASCNCLKNTSITKVHHEKSNRMIYNQKKQKLEENFEFIRQIYSENFIWELLEADYFDIDELCELSQLTKFELLKSKLKKDKEKIDKLYDNKTNNHFTNNLSKSINNTIFSNMNIYNNLNSKISNFTSNNFNPNINQTLNQSISPNTNFNITITGKKQNNFNESNNSYIPENDKNVFNFEEQILANDSDEKDSFYLEELKKAKSFMHLDENDFNDYDYLFEDNKSKKNKKKKKKKNDNNEKNIDKNLNNSQVTEKIKTKLIKTINSMSQKTISTLYKSINDEDKKTKKYLVKSRDGKYLKSKIIIKNEECDSDNKNPLAKPQSANINSIKNNNFLKDKKSESLKNLFSLKSIETELEISNKEDLSDNKNKNEEPLENSNLLSKSISLKCIY